tara:strand:- start:12429 stop:13082 length:654 start_codon:yes stop_codon:yes gene_type:complete
MLSDEVVRELETYALNVISQAKANLKDNKGGDLSESLDYRINDTFDWGGVLEFVALEYGNFLDQGVQGANPNDLSAPGTDKKGNSTPGSKWYGIQKAPYSPFRFGSGNGPSGGLRGAIDKWTITKGIPDIRGKDGRFLPRKSLVYLMTRSIYLAGLSPTYFFTKAQASYDSTLTNKLGLAFLDDVRLKTLELLDPLKTNAAYTQFSTSRRPRKKFNI